MDSVSAWGYQGGDFAFSAIFNTQRNYAPGLGYPELLIDTDIDL